MGDSVAFRMFKCRNEEGKTALHMTLESKLQFHAESLLELEKGILL